MPTRESILEFLKKNKSFFKKHFNIVKIGLFGSYARNEYTEASDIDIIVELEDNTEEIFEKKNALREYIKKHFQKDVDICREKYVKPYVKNSILKEALYV